MSVDVEHELKLVLFESKLPDARSDKDPGAPVGAALPHDPDVVLYIKNGLGLPSAVTQSVNKPVPGSEHVEESRLID